MNILIINYEFPPVGGGGGVAAKEFAEAFVADGHSVDYVTSHHPSLPKTDTVGGVTVHRVKVGRRDRATASLRSLLAFPLAGFVKASQLCLSNDYDMVNTHFAVPSGPLGVIISKLFDVEHVLSIHGGDIYDPTKEFSPHASPITRAIVRVVMEASDHVVAQSSNTRANAEKYYGVPESSIEKIGLPYSKKDFDRRNGSELGMSDDHVHLVTVGRLVKRKGYRYLLEAFERLDHDDARLVIIGDGPRRKELTELAEQLDVSERVKFTGYVDEVEKFQYLSNADVFCISSVHEGFGICIQEAMQTELPVVATNNGGQTDLITEDHNGYLVHPRDPDELADRLATLIDDETMRERMGKNNAAYLKDFDPERIQRKYVELVQGES